MAVTKNLKCRVKHHKRSAGGPSPLAQGVAKVRHQKMAPKVKREKAKRIKPKSHKVKKHLAKKRSTHRPTACQANPAPLKN